LQWDYLPLELVCNVKYQYPRWREVVGYWLDVMVVVAGAISIKHLVVILEAIFIKR
jgi:hypothetical protein